MKTYLFLKSFVIKFCLYAALELPMKLVSKCCDFDSTMIQQNEFIRCNDTQNSRIIISTDYKVKENINNECLEGFENNLYLFSLRNNEFTVIRNLTNIVFPKCCPPELFYNSKTKSCNYLNKTNKFDEKGLKKIGLSQCTVISDYKISHNVSYDSFDHNFCFDETVEGDTVMRTCEDISVCDRKRCLRKCCPDGQSFVNGSHCEDTFEHGLVLEDLSEFIHNLTEEFSVIHGYQTEVYLPTNLEFHLDIYGNFYSTQGKDDSVTIFPARKETYCIEHASRDGIELGHTFFRIFQKDEEELGTKFFFNRWAMVLSGILLVLTILHYVISGQTQTMFGKILVCFCVALLLLYCLLVFSTYKLNLHFKKTLTICKSLGFVILYLSFCSFSWLQIMCFDIYWKFGSSTHCFNAAEKRRKELHRFILYSSYGWGLPVLLTSLMIILHFADKALPEPLRIEIGVTRCYIETGDGNYAELIFRILPITIIQLTNSVIFIKTVRYCLKVQGEIRKMADTTTNIKKKENFFARRKRLTLVIKLSFTMGITYLFEVVSSFYDLKNNKITEVIEIIWDTINCLQGLFIFIIFVCKKKNLASCKKSGAMERIRRISLTTATRSTNLDSTRLRKISSSKWKTEKTRKEGDK